MATSSLQETPSKTQYRATQLWRRMVQGFRSGMPVCKHRVRMRAYDNCFSGTEAIAWLKDYLVTSGLFQSVDQQQVFNLLQKFLECNVIEDCKGKGCGIGGFGGDGGGKKRFEDCQHRLYRFVKCPGPLNFLDEDDFNTSVLSFEGADQDDSVCIANSFALKGDLSSPSSEVELEHSSSSDNQLQQYSNAENSTPNVASNGAHENPSSGADVVTSTVVASLWKEHTLARLLKLMDVPSLDLLIDASAKEQEVVDPKVIHHNVTFSIRRLSTSQRKNSRNHSIDGGGLENDLVGDVPGWVRMAIKCLSNWPEGCPEELTGGLPLYQGFEQDVLQSVLTYFQSKTEPLIPYHLYELFMSVHNRLLLAEGKGTSSNLQLSRATDSLQLCSLLMPLTTRTRLHRLLRMINKACQNPLLHLSESKKNNSVLLEQFSPLILRPRSRQMRDEQAMNRLRLVDHMVHNYRQMFLIPSGIQTAVDKEVELMQAGVIQQPNPIVPKFCERVSSDEYERQKSAATTNEHLVGLLGMIVRDEEMSSKEKKKKLKHFQKSYPELYIKHFPGTTDLSFS